MCVCVCVHSDTSTTRQVHGKLLAPTTDKTASATRIVELMGGGWGCKYRRKKGKGRKQLSVAGGMREKEGECRKRVKLNSRGAGVGERVNECVVYLLCPVPEWSVSKLSSNW